MGIKPILYDINNYYKEYSGGSIKDLLTIDKDSGIIRRINAQEDKIQLGNSELSPDTITISTPVNTITINNESIIFKARGENILEICENGDVKFKGKKVGNDEEIMKGLRRIINVHPVNSVDFIRDEL